MRGEHKFPSNPAEPDRLAVCGMSRKEFDDTRRPCPGPQEQRIRMPIDPPDNQ
jgi:hypothetical protein